MPASSLKCSTRMGYDQSAADPFGFDQDLICKSIFGCRRPARTPLALIVKILSGDVQVRPRHDQPGR